MRKVLEFGWVIVWEVEINLRKLRFSQLYYLIDPNNSRKFIVSSMKILNKRRIQLLRKIIEWEQRMRKNSFWKSIANEETKLSIQGISLLKKESKLSLFRPNYSDSIRSWIKCRKKKSNISCSLLRSKGRNGSKVNWVKDSMS